MRPLLRKDANWLVTCAALGAFIYLGASIAEGGQWTRPSDRFAEPLLAFFSIAATTLGLIAALFEDLLRTREYLVHRSVSHARVFWTRQLGCLAVLALWIFVVPALHLALSLVFRADAMLVKPGRYLYAIDESTVAFLFYALGLFSGTFVRRIVFALPLAALTAGFVAALDVARLLESEPGWLLDRPIWPVWLPLAAAFLFAAYHNDREDRDLDRPISRRRLWLSGGLLLAFLLPAGAFTFGAAQMGLYEGLAEVYPAVGRVKATGEYGLFVRQWLRPRLLEVDAQHRPLREIGEREVERVWKTTDDGVRSPATFERLTRRGRPFEGRATWGIICGQNQVRCWMASDGFIEVLRERSDEEDVREFGRPVRQRLGIGPTNQPFPRRSVAIGQWWDGVGYMADLDTGVVYSTDLRVETPQPFAPLPLPDGDRFRMDITVDIGGYWNYYIDQSGRRPLALVVAGERGIYALDNGKLAVPGSDVLERAKKVLADQGLRRQKQLRGPTGLDVTITRPDGSTVIAHQLAPRRPLERLVAAGIYATTVLRPTMFEVASLAVTVKADNDPDPRWMLDPFARQTPWPALAGNFALVLLLAGLTSRRLGRLGVPGERRWFWTVAVVLGGLPAYVTARLIENQRAWKPAVEPAPEPAPALLIQTA